MKTLLASLALCFLTACAYLPLRPGRADFRLPDGTSASVRQSQNPQQESVQVYERVTQPATNGVLVTTEKISTTVGAAQKDTAREIGAKLSSLKGIVWIGVLVFLFGAASAVYPPLKVIIGSVTTSAVIALAGLALIVLPTLIVGNEILILCVALGAALLYFFAHRHGKFGGIIDTLTKK